MSYQKVTGSLMANSHPGSYCGQDAYNDVLITEKRNENIFDATVGRVQGLLNRINDGCKDVQECYRLGHEGGCNNLPNQVRRLTPLECERLQGFPDNFTLIGERYEDEIWKDEYGNEYPVEVYKYKDSTGKLRKVSDSERYKALGNSIALPFWFYLLRRISAQYERPATMGSLFSGIGGFDLCWIRCNGEGTVLWTSEIEEFPNAVLRERFGE